MLPDLTRDQANQILTEFRPLASALSTGRTQELLKARQQAFQHIAASLTDKQRQVLASYPPGSRPQEFFHVVERLIAGAGLTSAQKQALQAWRQEHKEYFLSIQPELERRRHAMVGVDARSPEGLERLMALRELAQPLNQRRLEVARKLVKLLQDPQLEAWLRGLLPPDEALVARTRIRVEAVRRTAEDRQRKGQDVGPVAAQMQEFQTRLERGDLVEAQRALERAESTLGLEK